MIVQKFMRLLLVPGMAVPLVLVACSSDDSHFLMDTALVDAGLLKEGIADKIKSAAGSNSNGNPNSTWTVNAEDEFEFQIGKDTSTKLPMTENEELDRTLMADEKVFKGYDTKADLMGNGAAPGDTLHAVVFAHSGDMNDEHLVFGLWMVERAAGDMIDVGAFGIPKERMSSDEVLVGPETMMATFSGPSIGVQTDGESPNTFDATVTLTAEKTVFGSTPKYSIAGTVSDFNGIEMEDIKLGKSQEHKSNDKGLFSGTTSLASGDDDASGKWRAAFASANSISGSYGLSYGDESHLVGAFGAYKDEM